MFGSLKSALYRWPLRSGAPSMLERITALPLDHVTGADASPDGAWVALRTNEDLFFYRARELLAPHDAQPLRAHLGAVNEPQGEGVAFGADGRIYLTGEGGGSGAGTLATVKCALPR